MKQVKALVYVLFFAILKFPGHAQVGIGTETPDISALLDVSGTTGGLLPPRLTYNQMNAIVVSPAAEGLIVYCYDCRPKGMYCYNGHDFLNSITGIISGYKTVVSPTGRVWIDRNMGAAQVATSSTDSDSYGDLYQWGRGPDGHQFRDSSTTSTLSNSDTPGHSDFILGSSTPLNRIYDWHSLGNNNLWQEVDGINNPCPSGYRLPTTVEWIAEKATWSSQDALGAFGSPLRLPLAGSRLYYSGDLYRSNEVGFYWSSTVSIFTSSLAESLELGNEPLVSTPNEITDSPKASAFSVRCIKDY